MRTRFTDPFDVAKNIAGRTDPIVTRYFHSSVLLDRRGRIISTGRNHFTGSIITAVDSENDFIAKTIHSEVHALSRVNIRRLAGATIINYARTNVSSILSRPCPNCWRILEKLGLKKVFYSTLSDMLTPSWQEEYF